MNTNTLHEGYEFTTGDGKRITIFGSAKRGYRIWREGKYVFLGYDLAEAIRIASKDEE